MSEIYKYMYPFETREKMKSQEKFRELDIPWHKGNYKTYENFGNLDYLIRLEHEKAVKALNNKNIIIKRADWGKLYEMSGAERKTKLAESSVKDTYKLNTYYGRTLDDIAVVAKAFKNDCSENYGINISLQAALNYVYIKVVDETYSNYQRVLNTVLNLATKYPNYQLELTEAIICDNNDVDVFVYKDGEVIGGLQILPYKAGEPDEETMETQQKHSLFEMVYGVQPLKIFSNTSGFIKSPLPSL